MDQPPKTEQSSNQFWFPILMAILTAALSVGIIYLGFRYESSVVETPLKAMSFLFITFIVITFFPYLGTAYFLSKTYKASIHYSIIGLHGLFFYPVAVIFSIGPAMLIYTFFVCARIDLEVLLFAFTGGLMMLIMRAYLLAHYKFITSASRRWNMFWIGMISGTLFYWIITMIPNADFYSYPIYGFAAYSIFLVGFNIALILSLKEVNFKVINMILMLCFLAFLFDVFVNKRFDPVLYLNIPESEYFW